MEANYGYLTLDKWIGATAKIGDLLRACRSSEIQDVNLGALYVVKAKHVINNTSVYYGLKLVGTTREQTFMTQNQLFYHFQTSLLDNYYGLPTLFT